MRHGSELDFKGPPRMAIDKIAKIIKVSPNYVSRFLRKFFRDHDLEWHQKLWWKKGRTLHQMFGKELLSINSTVE